MGWCAVLVELSPRPRAPHTRLSGSRHLHVLRGLHCQESNSPNPSLEESYESQRVSSGAIYFPRRCA
jgi:hypothetical protein